jgi:amino acid adenylation domain-containing protein
MPGLESYTEGMSARQRQLFDLLLRQRARSEGTAAAAAVAGPRQPPLERRQAPPVLSFGQERLWFLQQLEPERAAYRIPAAVRLRGPLDTGVLEHAIQEVIRRHDTLRSTFKVRDGLPILDQAPRVDFLLPWLDLRHLPAAVRQDEARRHVAARAAQAFDLETGPLFRIELIHLDAQDHVLLVVLHHTISDTWSIGIFIRETAALYTAFLRGEPSPLPELPLQYSDFARWQREVVRGEVLERQIAFWRRQFEGIPTALELATDRPRPAIQTFRGARQYVSLGAPLTEALQELSQRREASIFMTLLAAIATLLFRYSGQEQILVGTPFSNRNRTEVEGLIGFFVNTLVLRSDFDDRPRFHALLARVRETTLGAYAHSDVPFERIVEALQLPRDMSRNPLWQVDFAFQNAPMPRLEVVRLALERFEIPESASRFDLEFDLRDTPDGLGGWIGYNVDLFEPATAARMAGHFRALLGSIVDDPERRVTELPLLLPAEREEVRAAAGGERVGSYAAVCLHRGFAERARATPEAEAIRFAGGRLTYGELERRANQLAWFLAARVRPEARVGICCERSPEMLVAILGVLKAGAAYVPIDPAYPRERIAFLLEDSRAPVLITQQALRGRLPEVAAEVVCLDGDGPRIAREPEGEPPSARSVLPRQVAYVIYTSGSTGRPKGVEVEHRQVWRLFAATADWFGFGPTDVWTLFHSHAFDFSVWEIWGPLLHGGTLVVVPYWVSRSPEAFLDLLAAERVTVLNQTPSAFLQLLRRVEEQADTPRDLALHWVILGGEALETRSLAPWFERYGDRRPQLVNMYGITETTVHVTFRPLSRADLEGTPRSVIGRPIPDLELHVLDDGLEPVPLGVPGEIYVGGDGLARGYAGRPRLTAERFIPHPWARRPGERLYRSGDLARRLPGGDLHYLGRRDQQVKIRGFRIELGEIEAALVAHPALRQAAVVPWEEGQRLVAYVVSRSEPAPGAEELRGLLADRLPEYMIPAAFVVLPELPLTPHGKLDRRALPAPEPARPELRAEYVAPRSPAEEALAAIWTAVLNLERVGVHDNFFELGGQSLLATQVASRVRDVFQVDLSLRTLFQQPTVAALAAAVEAARRGGLGVSTPPIVRVSRGGDLPLSFAQERLWFIHQLTPRLAAYNIPGAVRLTGPLDPAVLAAAFNAIARRHEVLRTTFTTVEGRPVQVIHPQPGLEIPVVDLRAVAAAQREAEALRLANAEARRPFDLSRGPLVRGMLLRLDEQVHLLVLNIHHIVYDMWSRVVFIRELGLLYEGFAAGRPAQLREMTLQYADFAHWQRQWMRGEALEEQLGYWKRQLAGFPAALELPTDRPRPASPSFRGARAFLRMTPELSDRLRELAREHKVTLFIVLLAGFSAWLHRLTGQRDVVVGSPIANRNRQEIEGLIGFFANTLVLRHRFPDGMTFSELLAAAREVAFGAYAHQDLAFERLVGELQPSRDQVRHPLVQVLFNFIQNYRPPDMMLGELRLSPEWVHNGSSAFDFTLSLWEADGALQGAMDYSVDLFDRPTPQRLLRQLMTLLAGAAAAPERPLAELGWAAASELHQILYEWNDTAADLPDGVCLHELIEARVDGDPDAPAVMFEGTTLTYRELDEAANRLARRLHSLGVRPGAVVGVCAERSLEMVVALCGVMKAGAAYLPLDPSYPDDRLAYMLGDARVPAVVTHVPTAGRPPGSGVPEVRLDPAFDGLAGESAQRLPRQGGPEFPAYAIYTSGSTGLPKGAVVHHAAICNRLLWMQAAYRLAPEERVLQKTPYSFDVSVWEFFWPLLTGACLVVARPGGHQDPIYLARVISERRVSTLHFVPSMLRLFLEAPDIGELPSLRRVIASGEALPAEVAKTFLARFPARLHNLYGPTEAAVDVTAWTCAPGEERVPIGRPIANLRTHVLDRGLRPLPIGTVGELYLAGAGLGMGYLGRPDLTADRFLPNPFEEAGGRLYRTGDLVRLLPDGALDFLGRTDHQVKLRGLRIELGEIETVLNGLPGVRAGAVVVRQDGAGNQYLAGYVVPEEAAGDLGDLRQALQRRLPQFMVPSALAWVEALPLGPTGKVDRRALMAIEGTAPASADALFLAPATDLERRLVAIWSELLAIDLERIGTRDNFFHLGGHSLLTTQLLYRLRAAFQVEIELSAFFDAPTIAGLAEAIEVERWLGDATAPPLAGPETEVEELAL